MFTGLVERTGELRGRARSGPGYRLEIATDLGPLELGESIAVSGVCLTVTAAGERGFSTEVSPETVERTTLGRLPLGAALNLERAVRLGDRLGGHLVSGHVDGVARVSQVLSAGQALDVHCDAPRALLRFIAPKGSVALDGVSLTVNRLSADGFHVMLIPHTQTVTNLRQLRPGRDLNLEVDLLARYAVHYLENMGQAEAPDPSGEPGIQAALRRAGLI